MSRGSATAVTVATAGASPPDNWTTIFDKSVDGPATVFGVEWDAANSDRINVRWTNCWSPTEFNFLSLSATAPFKILKGSQGVNKIEAQSPTASQTLFVDVLNVEPG